MSSMTPFPEPVYLRIAKVLRVEISELMAPGDSLDDQHALCRRFGASYVTVQRAMKVLVNEGLITRIPRRGTVVSGGAELGTSVMQCLTIRGWELNDRLLTVLRRFQKEHSLTIRLQEMEEGELLSCVRELYRRGSRIPCLFLNTWCLGELSREGLLEDLDGWVPDSILRDCHPVAIRQSQRDGMLKGIPLCMTPIVMFFNRAMFRKAGVAVPRPGWDWGDFLGVCKKLTARNSRYGTVDRYGFVGSASRNRWPVWVLQNQGKIFSESGQSCGLDQPEAKEAIQFYRDLVHVHGVAPFPSTGDFGGPRLFLTNRVGMFEGGFYFLRNLRDQASFEWDVVPLPKAKKECTYLSSVNFAIPKNVKITDQEMKLMKYLMSPASQALFWSKADGLPTRRSLWKLKGLRPRLDHAIDWGAFYQAVEHGHSIVMKPHRLALEAIQTEMQYVWNNLIPVPEACASACSKARIALKKNPFQNRKVKI